MYLVSSSNNQVTTIKQGSWLTMQLTSKINLMLNKSEKDMLELSTDFIVTFYGAYFLKSPMAAQAPSQDLDAFKLAYEMMNNKLYISKYGPLGKLLHASLVRHSWYLTPQLVILSIANRHLGLKERAGLAQKLLGFNCHQPDDFEKEQPQPPTDVISMSVLSDFITKESWLLFTYLGINTGVINSWIKDNFENDSYRHFHHQIENLEVV